ncbi:MAG: 5-methyltetrahydropteroyltriglutamate--homocysteine methyltransferase [Halolamina sp.]
MTEYVATTPGLFPLPDPAKDRLAELKGHQKHDLISGEEGPEIRDAYANARETVVADQREAGLDRVVEGQLRWDDMLAHPLTVGDAVDTGGIVRYYDNNNFYRDPQVVDDLAATGDVAAELDAASELLGEAAPSSLQATLPGPYSLARLATDEQYGDDEAFLDAVSELLAAEAEQFPAHETLFLLEPSLVTDAPGDDLAAAVPSAIDAVADAVDSDVVVHTYWGALDETTYAHLMDADVEALGFDLVAGDREQTLYNVNEYGTKDAVALGVADAQNTLVESADTLGERLTWFEGQVPAQTFERVYATPNAEPFYLPVSKHREKLTALAAAVDVAADEIADTEEVTA